MCSSDKQVGSSGQCAEGCPVHSQTPQSLRRHQRHNRATTVHSSTREPQRTPPSEELKTRHIDGTRKKLSTCDPSCSAVNAFMKLHTQISSTDSRPSGGVLHQDITRAREQTSTKQTSITSRHRTKKKLDCKKQEMPIWTEQFPSLSGVHAGGCKRNQDLIATLPLASSAASMGSLAVWGCLPDQCVRCYAAPTFRNSQNERSTSSSTYHFVSVRTGLSPYQSFNDI